MLKFWWILSIYTIWDGLSLKTISRYCPFNVRAMKIGTGRRLRLRWWGQREAKMSTDRSS
jgi:hypothetical protein